MFVGNPFVSYAQNLEDVVLSRLLVLVPQGRFIDVGAGHPQLENVTYSLYLHGWRGINVEPMAREVTLLREMRPLDETVQAAVGAEPGMITLYEAPLDNRGATTGTVSQVERYAAAGAVFQPFESPVVTLSSLLGRFDPGSVHLVKIDVEGMETSVLLGAALEDHQPWVLVIEATEPNSTISSHERWEQIVLDAGYRCVLFDGLNRFYVRSDLDDVCRLLALPANVLDNYISSSAVELGQLRHEFEKMQTYVASLHQELVLQQGVSTKYIESLLENLEATRQWATSAETYARTLELARDHPAQPTSGD